MADEPRQPSSDNQNDFDPLQDPEERAHIFSILDSFQQYRSYTHLNTTHSRRQAFYALPQANWQRLAAPPIHYLSTLSRIDDCIDRNADLAEAICENAASQLGIKDTEFGSPEYAGRVTVLNLSKARSTLNQLHRDWSAEGAMERSLCYEPVFRALQNFNVVPGAKVLVPGAGLGRLNFELSVQGYHTEGNEVSYHQLWTSDFILNHTMTAEQWTVYPWCCNFSNRIRRSDQFEAARIPDVLPRDATMLGKMSITSGDFCEMYEGERNEADNFDAVVTLFFIDTSPNLIKYVETVKNVLKNGGIWINVGPLQWHFDNAEGHVKPEELEEGGVDEDRDEDVEGKLKSMKIGSQGSFELCEEEVLQLVRDSGFDILRHDGPHAGWETGYIQDPNSMLQSKYRSSHWVAKKL